MRHCYSSLQLTYTFKTRSRAQNTKTANASTLCVYWTGTMFRQITIAYFELAAPSTMLEAYVAIYMSDESKPGHVALTFQNFKRFSVETRLQASKETKSLDDFTGWMECEYLIMPSLQPMSKIFRFIIKQ